MAASMRFFSARRRFLTCLPGGILLFKPLGFNIQLVDIGTQLIIVGQGPPDLPAGRWKYTGPANSSSLAYLAFWEAT